MTLAIPFAWKVTNQTHLVKLVEVGFLAEYVNQNVQSIIDVVAS
ncbi:hypothetical protein LINPERPRIM_LOCUS4021 [Linum perenne]